MKKLFRNRGLVERRGSLRKRGGGGGGVGAYCFISFSSEKHVFVTIGILFFSFFFSGIYSCLLFSIILSCGLLLLENDIL